jgi:hypothetical protein
MFIFVTVTLVKDRKQLISSLLYVFILLCFFDIISNFLPIPYKNGLKKVKNTIYR